LLHYALMHPASSVGIVGPSWRQTKLRNKHINALLQILPKTGYRKPHKTAVALTNGSTIEAYQTIPKLSADPPRHHLRRRIQFYPQRRRTLHAHPLHVGHHEWQIVCSSTLGTPTAFSTKSSLTRIRRLR
jgi:hypothetical protein